MDFREYIESYRKEIHSTISRYLPLKEPLEYSKMMRDYSERQGKYVRPGLLMLSGEMFGKKPKDLILPGAIMQISEDWILMHDDIEDQSEMRRGKPAVQRLYGTSQAINAGDAVHLTMWKMLMDYTQKTGLKAGLSFQNKFHEILETTVEGQYLDLKFVNDTKQVGKASEKMYFDIISRKTNCYSVYGPMQLGATVANQSGKVLEALRTIGEYAGTAFQIMDDVLDLTADEKAFGKKRYGDLYEGKLTLIILDVYKKSTRAERLKIDRIYRKGRKNKTGEDIEFLLYLIEKYKSIDYATRISAEFGKKAESAIQENLNIFPDNKYREIFFSAITGLFIRKK